MDKSTNVILSVCNYCGIAPPEGTKFQVCSACKLVSYCGKDCQKKDWKVHQMDCQRIKGGMKKIQKEFQKYIFLSSDVSKELATKQTKVSFRSELQFQQKEHTEKELFRCRFMKQIHTALKVIKKKKLVEDISSETKKMIQFFVRDIYKIYENFSKQYQIERLEMIDFIFSEMKEQGLEKDYFEFLESDNDIYIKNHISLIKIDYFLLKFKKIIYLNIIYCKISQEELFLEEEILKSLTFFENLQILKFAEKVTTLDLLQFTDKKSFMKQIDILLEKHIENYKLLMQQEVTRYTFFKTQVLNAISMEKKVETLQKLGVFPRKKELSINQQAVNVNYYYFLKIFKIAFDNHFRRLCEENIFEEEVVFHVIATNLKLQVNTLIKIFYMGYGPEKIKKVFLKFLYSLSYVTDKSKAQWKKYSKWQKNQNFKNMLALLQLNPNNFDMQEYKKIMKSKNKNAIINQQRSVKVMAFCLSHP